MTTAQWRTVTLVLAVVFLILVALLVVVILGRTGPRGGAGATSTPDRAAASASASAAASEAAAATPASSGPTATASVAASPSAAASATLGTVPSARADVEGLGIDDPDSPQATPRVIVFTSEGGGDVTVKLLAASGGKVELCIYPGTLAKPLGDRACLRNVGGTLTGHHKGKKPFTWTATLTAVKRGTTPSADVRIDWATTAPRLELADVRLQGTGADPYGSVTILLARRPAGGAMGFAAGWRSPDGTIEESYQVTIRDRDTNAILGRAKGTGSGAELSVDLAARQRTMTVMILTDPLIVTPILTDLVLTWP